MNEQASMMNQKQQQPLMNMNQSLMNMNQHQQQQPKPQVIKFNQKKLFANPYSISQSGDWNNFRPQMAQMGRSHWMWPPPQQFRNPNSNPGAMNPPSSASNKSLVPRNNWKRKKVNNKPNDKRRMEQKKSLIRGVDVISGGGGGGRSSDFNSFNAPKLNELRHQNRLKTRKFSGKRKFSKKNSMNMNTSGDHTRSAPFAPRNTTSFIIRSKKSGGIAPFISPCPVTPSVLPTPVLSPSRELLVDMAKEEWGVDGYGSMKGLIRLRSPGHEMNGHYDDEEGEGRSSESDVEEHVQTERRLDHDLSRFKMISNPNSVNNNALENRVDDQDNHIARLVEENLILKERLYFMERELGDLRRRMMCLERMGDGGEVINEDIVANGSENRSEIRSVEENIEDFNEEAIKRGRYVDGKGNDDCVAIENIVESYGEGKVENKDGLNVGGKNNNNSAIAVESKEESNKNGDESIVVDNMNEIENYGDKCVDRKVGGDVCMLEDGIAQDYTDC